MRPLDFIVPNLLVSRGKPVLSSPSAAAPAWVAVQVGVGPSRVLVSWATPTSSDSPELRSAAPEAYRIESSADSSNGGDGTWRVELSVADNPVRSRAHSVEYDGQSWVRLVLTGTPDPEGSVRMDVHDASDGTDDTWLFLGDAAGPFVDGGEARSFAEHIHAEYPGYFPALIDGGVPGELTTAALARIEDVLALHPDFRHVALAYGSADARSGQIDGARFRINMAALVARVIAAGRVPVLARVPFSPEGDGALIREYNRAIEALEREQGLLPGPDLYAWFEAHPDQWTDGALPGAAGRAAIQRLWAEAVDVLYAPQ